MQEQSPLTHPELRQRIGMGWLGVIHAAGQGPDGTPLGSLSPADLRAELARQAR